MSKQQADAGKAGDAGDAGKQERKTGSGPASATLATPVAFYFPPGTEAEGPYPCFVTHRYADGSADLAVANNPQWPLAGPGGSRDHGTVMRSRVVEGTPGKTTGEFWSRSAE